MNEELLRFNKDATFLVMDFETTGLNLFLSKPWQFACVMGKGGKIFEKHNIFIHWDSLNMEKGAEIATRFDMGAWADKAIPTKEAFKTINEKFEEADYIGGHNLLGYDANIYYSSCERIGVTPYPIHTKILDTLSFGKGIKLETPYRKGEDVMAYQLRMASIIVRKRGFATLSAFADYYDIKFDPDKLHDALEDVSLNYKVLMKMIWDIEL